MLSSFVGLLFSPILIFSFFMRTFRWIGILSTSTLMLAVAASVVFADGGVRSVLDRAAPAAGLQNACGTASCIPTIIGGLITLVLGLLGVALIGYVVYAGYLWMTAAGEAKQVEEAQTVLRNAVIGIVIIGFSYTLTGVGLRFIREAFNSSVPDYVAPTAPPVPGTPAPEVDRTPSRTNPFREGCRRTSCTSECIPINCSTFSGQRRFTCESGCRTECEARCPALDGPPAPSPTDTRCVPLADYRQCLANCASDITERARAGEYATPELQSDALAACNGDCTYLYCR